MSSLALECRVKLLGTACFLGTSIIRQSLERKKGKKEFISFLYYAIDFNFMDLGFISETNNLVLIKIVYLVICKQIKREWVQSMKPM